MTGTDEGAAAAARTPTRDPLRLLSGGEGIITGTVVCAATIAAGAGHLESIGLLTLAILGSVFVYWLAHLHAHALGTAIALGHRPKKVLRTSLAATWPIAGASLLPVGVLLVAKVFGATVTTAAWIALIATVLLLTSYSYVAERRGGGSPWASLAAAAAGGSLGLLIVLLKAALH